MDQTGGGVPRPTQDLGFCSMKEASRGSDMIGLHSKRIALTAGRENRLRGQKGRRNLPQGSCSGLDGVPDPGYMFKVDLTGFADGMVAGVERKVSRVRLCWEEEEQVGGDRARGGGNQEFPFECFIFGNTLDFKYKSN